MKLVAVGGKLQHLRMEITSEWHTNSARKVSHRLQLRAAAVFPIGPRWTTGYVELLVLHCCGWCCLLLVLALLVAWSIAAGW